MEERKKTAGGSTDGVGIRKIEHWQVVMIYLMLYDALAAVLSYFFALWLRFDCHYTEIPAAYLSACLRFAPIYAVVSVAVLWAFRLYRSIWRFASFDELKRIALSAVVLGVLHAAGITLLFHRMPISYYVIGFAVQAVLVMLVRFAYRFILLERGKKSRQQQKAAASRLHYTDSSGQDLYVWLVNQKQSAKSGRMSDERKRLLRAVGALGE